MAFGDGADEGEAQTRAAMIGTAVAEGLEQTTPGLFRQTRALIADAEDADRAAVFLGPGQPDLMAPPAGPYFRALSRRLVVRRRNRAGSP